MSLTLHFVHRCNSKLQIFFMKRHEICLEKFFLKEVLETNTKVHNLEQTMGQAKVPPDPDSTCCV